ncbi:FtsQ-type POTRA domain-containing protein [Neobacillus niacini]|uniref:cell division protein FtsQ/DivIB n=1 Tax=Neobacillus niacini TaxID=86668 RepID=UPI00285F8F03|nr:FtsQ-type POTRA domain-containing protein [Neobacillus niacini]MDR6997994.1 cell division protein FtsQ [Neobacillus niacini]
MDKGKIVALEDRIPKLKEQRRRKANRRLILLLFLFFALIAAIAYMQSPLSHIKQISVKGNDLYSSKEIIKKTGVTKNTNIWKVKSKEISKKLKELSEVKKADVKIQWPNTVFITIQEHNRIAYLKKEGSYYPVMENGKILKGKWLKEIPNNSPILFDFEEGDVLNEMVDGLKGIPAEIVNSISEIHYTPKKTDKYHISLFMNDGFEVSATLRSFSEKMVHYPSIVSQLDPNKKGVIDLEVGSYFKAYDTKTEDQKK